MIIPQNLREFAEIDGEALVMGMINRIEIWSKSEYESFEASHKDVLTEAVSMIKLL